MELFGPWLMFDLTSSLQTDSFTTNHHLHQTQHQTFGDHILKAEEIHGKSTVRAIDEAPTVPHTHTTSFFYLTISGAFCTLF